MHNIVAMEYDMQLLKNEILEIFVSNQIKYQLDDFPSGCTMIDFSVNGTMLVIQLEPEGIGLSHVNDEIDLSTIPDEWHFDVNGFLKKIKTIIESK